MDQFLLSEIMLQQSVSACSSLTFSKPSILEITLSGILRVYKFMNFFWQVHTHHRRPWLESNKNNSWNHTSFLSICHTHLFSYPVISYRATNKFLQMESPNAIFGKHALIQSGLSNLGRERYKVRPHSPRTPHGVLTCKGILGNNSNLKYLHKGVSGLHDKAFVSRSS